MRKNLSILLFIIASGFLWSQTDSTGTVIDEPDDNFIIQEIHYITDKYTRSSSLERELGIAIGTGFKTREDLEIFLEDKAQHLWNLRVLDDVRYMYEETIEEDGRTGVSVVFEVDGSWTIYPIVYPKYDSNTGFRIGGQLYYDNFFGTLTKFYLGGNIDIQPGDDGYEITQWSLNPRISNITFGRFTFDMNVHQEYDKITKYNSEQEKYEEDYTRYSTSINLDTAIRLPKNLYYSFGPSFQWFYLYHDNLPDNGSNIQKDDVQFSWGHSVGLNDLDWHGNFRQGLALSFGNSIAWAQDIEEGGKFKTSIQWTARAFYIWKRLNPSVKFSGIYSFNEEKSGLGGSLRGIRNEDMYGIAAAYLNTSLNISVIPWEGVGEALCQPFFDIGAAFKEDGSWDPERDFKYSTGADFILYLDVLKSLVARGSVGIDLTNPDWSDSRKYEFTVESALHY